MSGRASDILNQLQLKLTADNKKANLIPSDVEEMFGPGFATQYADDLDDDHIDVPDAGAVDRTYVTHRTFVLPKGKKGGSNYLPFETESALQEQDEDEDKKGEEIEADADMAADAAEEAAEEATGESDEEATDATGVGPDEAVAEEPAGMEAGMGDMGMAGMGIPGQEEEEKTAGELGRIYELKKIYSRLTSIESYLSDESSGHLSEIRNYVSQCIELFEIVSSNFDSYKDKLDEIIVMYYKFIIEVYDSVKDFYKKETNAGDK